MDDVIELENLFDDDGFRVVHLMSNAVLNFDALKAYHAPADAMFDVRKEAGVHHLRAKWLLCGPLVIKAEGWPQPKRFLVWNLSLAGSVKIALFEANRKYEDLFSKRAEYAFIRKLPRGVENGVEVGNLMLFEAEWMVRKCVAVGFNYQ